MFEAFDQLRQFLLDQRQELVVVATERQRQNSMVLENEGTKRSEAHTIITEGNSQIRVWTNKIERKSLTVSGNENTISSSTATLAQVTQLRQDKINAYNADRDRIVQAIEGCRAAIECLKRL
jgi:transcription initiation factor IIF auxiliary subunit